MKTLIALAILALQTMTAHAQSCTVKVGRILPQTGPLAEVTKDSPWVDDHKIGPINSAGGLKVGDQRCRIEYKIYDSKSTIAGSADAATRAILQDKVDVLMALGTPDTTNAPSDLCERHQIPCIMAGTPIEAWLFGPDGKPKTYKHAFMFFFSVVDLVKNHIGMIKEPPGGFNGNIGYLYPNDPDGTIFASLFDPEFKKAGWNPTDPGRFAQGLPDFTPIINKFKRARVEVVTGVLAPPDLQNYLQQAAQQGFKPKMYVIDKATGYPEPMNALGKHGEGVVSVNFWSPAFPGKSKYGGYDGEGLVQAYEKSTGKQYIPPLALNDASYDVLFDALQRAGSTDRAALLKALRATALETVTGTVKFNEQNYSVQPLGGAQWREDPKQNRLVKENVYNAVFPSVKKTAEMKLY
ncbi:MAG: ABC transporter substrate-binding protein [Burkholderiaceae bacterium]